MTTTTSDSERGSPPPPATTEADRSVWARRWHDIRFPVLTFLAIAAVLYLVVFASAHFLPRHEGYPIKQPLVFRGAGLLEGWVRYDGGWYRFIATTGCGTEPTCGYFYNPGAQSPVAFFPAYPMSMRIVGFVTGDVLLAGIMITFLCGLGTAVLLYRWACRMLSPPTAKLAVLMFLLFPYAWYVYGAVYADALFLVCAIGAFVLVEKDRPVLAGLLAAVSTATRPIGIGLIIGLLAVHLDRRGVIVIPYLDRVRQLGWRRARTHAEPTEPAATGLDDEPKTTLGVALRLRRLRFRDAGILLAGGGLAAWSMYLWVTFGSPFIFSEIQKVPGWDQGQGPRTWFKIHWMGLIKHFPEYAADQAQYWEKFVYTIDVSFQGVLAISCLLLVPLVVRRLGWSYAVYTLAVVMIPVLGTKDWQGTGRYLLAAFPVIVALADWLIETNRTKLRNGLLVASGAILLLLTSGYARGYYLA